MMRFSNQRRRSSVPLSVVGVVVVADGRQPKVLLSLLLRPKFFVVAAICGRCGNHCR